MKQKIQIFNIHNLSENSIFRYIHRLSTLILLMAPCMLTSCMDEFNPGLDEDNILVVNILAFADSTITASVTHSWTMEQAPPSTWNGIWPPERKDFSVADADIDCTVNGERVLMNYNPESGYYVSDRIIKAGDHIAVKAHSRKYGDAGGEVTVPQKTQITDIKCKVSLSEDQSVTNIYPSGSSYGIIMKTNYEIKFSDPPGESNYYMVTLDTSMFNELDPIFLEHVSGIDNVLSDDTTPWNLIFSDKNIDGKTYTLKFSSINYEFSAPGSYGPVPEYPELWTRTITLRSISESYYLYLLSLQKKYFGIDSAIEGLGLAEPKVVYSNVNPGVGIIGGVNLTEVTYDTYPLFYEAYQHFTPTPVH